MLAPQYLGDKATTMTVNQSAQETCPAPAPITTSGPPAETVTERVSNACQTLDPTSTYLARLCAPAATTSIASPASALPPPQPHTDQRDSKRPPRPGTGSIVGRQRGLLCVHPSPVCTACVASSPPLLAFDWDPPSPPLAISITLLTSPHQSSTDCVTFTHQSAFERLVKLACSVTLSNENVLLPLHTFKSSTAHARSLSRRRFFAPPTHPTVCFSLSPGPLCSLGYCPLAQLHLCPSWRRCQRRIPQVVGVSTSVVLQKCFLAPCFLLFFFLGRRRCVTAFAGPLEYHRLFFPCAVASSL